MKKTKRRVGSDIIVPIRLASKEFFDVSFLASRRILEGKWRLSIEITRVLNVFRMPSGRSSWVYLNCPLAGYHWNHHYPPSIVRFAFDKHRVLVGSLPNRKPSTSYPIGVDQSSLGPIAKFFVGDWCFLRHVGKRVEWTVAVPVGALRLLFEDQPIRLVCRLTG